MNKKSFFCILFLLLGSLSAEAKRTIKQFPLDTPGGWAKSGHPFCWAGLSRKITFINLGAIPQTVTVRIKDVRLSFGSCDGAVVNPPFSGNWSGHTLSHCWDSPEMPLPNLSRNIVIAPNSSQDVSFTGVCRTRRSGVDSCQWDATINNSNHFTDLVGVSLNKAQATLEIEVAEDRGALLANVVAAPTPFCNTFESTSIFNIPLNGGRPF